MKVAWILPGGGSNAVYTAGCVAALHELGMPKPDIIIAASGSGSTAFYYAAGQQDSMKYMWTELFSSKEFVNPLRFWKILNLEHLIEEVFKKQMPLNMDEVRKSKIKVFIPVVEANTGKIKFFSNKDKVDLWKVLRATKSAPLFTNIKETEKVNIDGVDYLDSVPSSRPYVHIDKAIAEGADKILVLDSLYPHSRVAGMEPIYKIFLKFQNEEFRKNQLEYLSRKEKYKGAEILHITPKEKLPLSPWTNKKKHLVTGFNQGFSDTGTNGEVKKFLVTQGHR